MRVEILRKPHLPLTTRTFWQAHLALLISADGVPRCRVVLFVLQMLTAGRLSKEMGLLQNSTGPSATGTCLARHDDRTRSILWLLVCMAFVLRKPTSKTRK